MTLGVLTTGMEYTVATATATIASGAAVSGAVDLQGRRLAGVVMPAAFTNTKLRFDVSADGTTYQALRNPEDDSLVEMTVQAGASYSTDISVLWAWPYLKIRTPGNEAGTRVITLLLRPI